MTTKRKPKAGRPSMAAALPAQTRKAPELLGHDAVDRAIAAVEPVRLLTPKQASEILAVSRRTLEYWRMTGEGPRYLKLSRATIRYTAIDLASFQVRCARRNTV